MSSLVCYKSRYSTHGPTACADLLYVYISICIYMFYKRARTVTRNMYGLRALRARSDANLWMRFFRYRTGRRKAGHCIRDSRDLAGGPADLFEHTDRVALRRVRSSWGPYHVCREWLFVISFRKKKNCCKFLFIVLFFTRLEVRIKKKWKLKFQKILKLPPGDREVRRINWCRIGIRATNCSARNVIRTLRDCKSERDSNSMPTEVIVEWHAPRFDLCTHVIRTARRCVWENNASPQSCYRKQRLSNPSQIFNDSNEAEHRTNTRSTFHVEEI